MKLKKIFASAFAAVAAITSVASLTSCKKDDDVTDDGGNDQGGNENDAAAEIQAKLEAAINGLSVKSSYEADFTLPTTAAGGVTISWASDNVNVVKIENGKATITRPGLTEADATVKITATAVIDGETKVKEFTVTIPHVADESKTIAVIKGLEAGAKTAAKGIVTGFAYNEKNDITVRSGFYLTDGTDTIYVFGKNAAAELSIGDEIYLNAEKSIYYGAHQLSYPSDVVKLGENKTPTYANVITDKTITELATAPKPGDNETTNQGKVYELLAYFEKSGSSTYVNYRVVDPYNTANYLNVYFTATVVPGETYEFTEAYEAYAGKYCKVKFYMAGTNSSGKWRGHILGFEDLTEAESAKMLLVQATEDIPAVIPVTTPTTEVELTAVTLPTGATLDVTSTCTNVTYADGKITITKPEEDITAEIKFAVKVGELTVAEYTKTVELKVGATDITSLVTIEDGVITIPYTAITYAGEHVIDLGDGKKLTINYGKYVDKSSYKEVGLANSGVITFTTEGFKLDALISDVYGTYDNMACYAGTDATGTKIIATKGKGQGTTYTYAFTEATNNIYFVNTSDSHDVAFFGLELVLEGSLDALKAEAEAERLANIIEDLYEVETDIDLSSTAGTVVITPQTGATTLTVDGTTLTVTPGATEVTETITIKVTIGDAEFTTEAINIKSKAFAISKGDFSVTAEYTEGVTSNTVVSPENDATKLGLKTALFVVYSNKGSLSYSAGLNKDGSIRLYTGSEGNGTEFVIEAQDLSSLGYELTINKVTLTYGTDVNTFTVNGVTGSKDTAEYTINSSKVTFKNTGESGQVHIKSIVIDYTIADKEPTEYTVDLTKTEFNLKDEATMPTVEYDVYASVWGGTEPIGTFIPVDADGKFDVVGSFTGVTLVLIKKGETPAWSGDNFLAQTIDYTVEGTTVLAPFDGTEDYVEYTLDLSKIQYNLSTETTLPAEYDVYVTVWGGTEPAGGLVQVDAEGKFKVLGTFTNATVLLIVKGETPAWEGAAFIAKTKDYTLTDTTIAGPFDGTEVAVAYEVDLSATKYNLKNDAEMPTVEYDVYATVWGGTATTGTFIPVTLNGIFEVLGTFTNASLILIAKDQTPAWSGDNFLAQTTDYTVNETTLVAPIGSPVTHAEYVAAEVGDTLTIKATIVAVQDQKKYVFLQDSEGLSYVIYNNSGVDTTTWAVVGNEVVVYGSRGDYNKLQQITSEQILEIVSTGNVINPTDVTADIIANGLTVTTENQAKYVTVTGEVSSVSSNYFNIKVGTNTVKIFTYASKPDFITVGTNVTLTGHYIVFNTTPQIGIYNAVNFVDARTDEEKAEDELDRLVALFAETYNQTTEIDLTSTVGTVVVTPQVGATTLAVDGTKLTVTPTSTEVTETVTISVTVGEATKTSDTISIKSVVDNSNLNSATDFTVISENYTTAADCDEASFGLDGTVFTVTADKKSSSGYPVVNAGSDEIRIYGNASGGGQISISITNGTIKSIKVTYSSANYNNANIFAGTNTTAVADSNDSTTIGEYVINDTTFTISNANSGTTQVRIKSIEITYSLNA